MKTFIVEGNGWERAIEVDDSAYEKYGDMGMEAMTQAIEQVVEGEGEANFGFILMTYENGFKGDEQKTVACLTEIVLRNAGYYTLAEEAKQAARKMIEGS